MQIHDPSRHTILMPEVPNTAIVKKSIHSLQDLISINLGIRIDVLDANP